ncbi:unnamed protein product [Ranitomeya imitator]|uniref:PAT complex subunit CCDC47 n=1 Tax=Ranitomeya imitator TaxID=111125 RepID=A0ABN9KYC2_9NEOB|nr:unnamed protein product [Ranitomeya imitator]
MTSRPIISTDSRCNIREGQPLKLPETKKTLLFTFNVPGAGNASVKDMESLLPLMNMVIYSIDKVKKFRLNREGKQKADKNRARVEENFLKLTHVQRQEAAQTRREEKKRAEKERIMNEEDPEKQRRLEEAAQRREQKKMEKKQMKMKQIKVKAMADKVRRSRGVKTRRGCHGMKMGGPGVDLRHPFDQNAAGPPLGNIGGLSTALQNAVDKPLMTLFQFHISNNCWTQ